MFISVCSAILIVGSVVRSSVRPLRLDLLDKIAPSDLWLEALVHHAALTAYHKDYLAKAAAEDSHASCTILPCRLGNFSPRVALRPGVSPCLSPRLLPWTVSASAS